MSFVYGLKGSHNRETQGFPSTLMYRFFHHLSKGGKSSFQIDLRKENIEQEFIKGHHTHKDMASSAQEGKAQ